MSGRLYRGAHQGIEISILGAGRGVCGWFWGYHGKGEAMKELLDQAEGEYFLRHR